ncbi:hypothetical protein PG994_003426 [Apiospora phragmitis]|uniref:Aminoacyl-tRNA synthetase class II (D/K/N) domain-containing protein n=1 Tax=Apiospora phragmitis TaxID=2905665 RepID=A0ABR1VY54_9PEZI
MDSSGRETHPASTSRFNQLRLIQGYLPGHEVSFYARVHEVRQRSDEGEDKNQVLLLMREEAWFVDVAIGIENVSASAWEVATKCTAESILHVVGSIIDNPRATAVIEATTSALPLIQSLSLHERLNHRILDVRVAANGAIFKLFSGMLSLASQHCIGRGMHWIQTPSLINYKIATDDDYFPVSYPGGQPAWLSQTVELHHELALSMDFQRVFEIKHMFRAEKDISPRRLSEMAKKLHSSAGDFKLGLDARGRLPRVNYVEAKQLLREHEGMQTDDNGDLTKVCSHEEEAMLGKLLRRGVASRPSSSGKPSSPIPATDAFFITDYPQRQRPPQTVPNRHNGPADEQTATDTCDLIARGQEVASILHFTGSHEVLRAALRDQATERDPDAPMWRPWLQAFEAGLLPHVNFAFGMNRVLQSVLGLGDVREATLFPRDAGRLAP